MSVFCKQRMLRAMAAKPQKLITFTEADIMLALPIRHVEKWAAELMADGLIVQHGDFYIATAEGVAELAKQPTTATPRIWCAASSAENYAPKPWTPSRPGADQHRQFLSRGMA